jgi:hypothetical protein
MAGQPGAPEDFAATLLPAEPDNHGTVFMVRVQRPFRCWGLMVRSAGARPRVSNHDRACGAAGAAFFETQLEQRGLSQ